MSEEYKPKFDFEVWRDRIILDLQTKLKNIILWERNEKSRILRAARAEETEVRASQDQSNVGQRLKDIQTVVRLSLERVEDQFRTKTKEVIESSKRENLKLEEEYKVDKMASEITQTTINEIILQVEKNIGAKSDKEIEREIDEKEWKWKNNKSQS